MATALVSALAPAAAECQESPQAVAIDGAGATATIAEDGERTGEAAAGGRERETPPGAAGGRGRETPPGAAGGRERSQGRGPGGFGDSLGLGSSREPITITASQLDFDYQKNHVTYRGSVHVVQGDLVLDSDTLIVTLERTDDQRQARLREVIAQGNVVIVQGTRRATGATAVFSQAQRQIVLVGDPVLRDGPNEVTGDRIIVFVDEGRSIVESSPSKRVSAVLYPGTADSGGAGAETSRPVTANGSGTERPVTANGGGTARSETASPPRGESAP